LWAPKPDAESADVLRRMAWEILWLAVIKQLEKLRDVERTSGQTREGVWINGRGDDTMTMLQGYARMVDFFTSFEWWKTEPRDDLVTKGDYCLAKPGEIYAVYLPHGGLVNVRLQPGSYDVTRFNPASGERIALPTATGPVWDLIYDAHNWRLGPNI